MSKEVTANQKKRNKTEAEKEYAIQQISRLYFQHVSPYDMKPELLKVGVDLSVPTIYKYIAKMKDQWRESRSQKIEDIILEELAKLDNYEYEVWQSWQNSKQQEDTQQTHTKRVAVHSKKDKTTKPQIKEQNITETKKVRDGNPKFMEILLGIHDRRMALIGKDKAVNIFVQNNFEQNNTQVNNVMTGGNYIIEIDERQAD